jgi:hypothetical protein
MLFLQKNNPMSFLNKIKKLIIGNNENCKSVDEIKQEKASSLLREATSLKKTNINLAIEKIKNAIELGYGDYYKLSSYLLFAGKIEEAIFIYKDIIIPKSKIREIPYNSLGYVYQKYSSLFYRIDRLEDYFYYASLSAFYYITHNFTYESGDCDLLKCFFESRKPLYYTGQANFERALKKIGKLDLYEEYEETFMKLFDELKGKIYEAAKTNCFIEGITKETKRKFFIFTEDVFNEFYKNNLRELIN